MLDSLQLNVEFQWHSFEVLAETKKILCLDSYK